MFTWMVRGPCIEGPVGSPGTGFDPPQQKRRSPMVTIHRTDLPGCGPAILPLSTAAAFPCSVAGLRRFTAHYQPRGPRLRANPAVDHRLGSDRSWMHMTGQVDDAKHRIHIGRSAHSGHRQALPSPTCRLASGCWARLLVSGCSIGRYVEPPLGGQKWDQNSHS